MVISLFKRREHSRRSPSGRTAHVRATMVSSSEKETSLKKRKPRPCPVCGKPILTTRMRGGGMVHFNGAEGLTNIKHACLHIGDGLGRRRGVDMNDLFDPASE